LDEVKWLITQEIPCLRRYALALTNNPDAADDLVQDCLERAVRKRHQWKRQGSVRGWLFRILQRCFYDRRAAARRQELPVEEIEVRLSQDPHQDGHMALSDIRAAMQRLPEQQRAAIALTALEGLSYDEAAEILDIPIGTLRSRLARGREALRRLYARPPSAHLRRVK